MTTAEEADMSPLTQIPVGFQEQQPLFDKIVSHLRQQGAKAMNRNGVCAYRNHDGKTACAAGSLISDEEYYEGLERHSIHFLFALWPREARDLIGDMQGVHDQCEPESWEQHFAQVAANFSLVLAPLPTTEKEEN